MIASYRRTVRSIRKIRIDNGRVESALFLKYRIGLGAFDTPVGCFKYPLGKNIGIGSITCYIDCRQFLVAVQQQAIEQIEYRQKHCHLTYI